jgi:hypothetical protein
MSSTTFPNRLTWRYVLVKALIFQVVFLILHFLYDFFPNPFTAVVSGTSEAVFQHIKIGFFACLAVSVGEYLIYRKRITAFNTYFVSRLFSTTFYPWVMFVLFFIAPAYYGHIESIPVEIIYANLVLLTATSFTIIIEHHIASTMPSRVFQIVILILFLVSLSLYVIFSFKNPWHDVFAIPPGWD